MKNEHVFSFYLDESIWFKEGQGVRELIGISLDPEVGVMEEEGEILVRGKVELAGEYIPVSDFTGESADLSARFADSVQDGEDGTLTFVHDFPVEITIPSYRVPRLEDVRIEIESFDYEVPASHQLRLNAQLNISGVELSERSEAENAPEFTELPEIGPVDFKELEVKVREETAEEAPVLELKEESSASSNEDGRWPTKKTQSFADFFGKEEANIEVESASFESTSIGEESVSSSSSLVISPSVKEESSSSESECKSEENDGMSGFKQIFKHLFPNREESYTQMKMYIAQENETLESIAEKYGVTVKQLERLNEDREDVLAGEIVYIPS